MTKSILGVVLDVVEERRAQDTEWGEQNHPDGTGGPDRDFMELQAKSHNKQRVADGKITWLDILEEEVREAFAAPANSDDLRAELVQVAAVAVAWIEAIDRRKP